MALRSHCTSRLEMHLDASGRALENKVQDNGRFTRVYFFLAEPSVHSARIPAQICGISWTINTGALLVSFCITNMKTTSYNTHTPASVLMFSHSEPSLVPDMTPRSVSSDFPGTVVAPCRAERLRSGKWRSWHQKRRAVAGRSWLPQKCWTAVSHAWKEAGNSDRRYWRVPSFTSFDSDTMQNTAEK